MHHIVKGGNGFACLRVGLAAGESLWAGQCRLVACSEGVRITPAKDGVLRRMARKFTKQDSPLRMILAGDGDGWAVLAPAATDGGIIGIELHGGTDAVHFSRTALLAADPSVTVGRTASFPFHDLSPPPAGAKHFAALDARGGGMIFLGGFGTIEALTLLPEQSVLIDAGHLVAWENGVTFHPVCAQSGWRTVPVAGMETMVAAQGAGRVWIQTRQAPQRGPIADKSLPDPEKSCKSDA